MSNFYKKNKINVNIIIIANIFLGILLYFDYFSFCNKVMKEVYHYNLLTINAIFAGFLFTSLGLMVSFNDHSTVNRMDNAGYLDEYYNSIYLSLFFHIASIVSSVVIILGLENQATSILEKYTLIFGIIFFVKSIFNLISIINLVRGN